MKKQSCLALALTVWLATLPGAGCSKPISELPEGERVSYGPHGGPTAVLAPTQAVAEVVQETTGGKTRLVIYFFDGSTMAGPPSTEPSGVTFALELPGGSSQSVPLTKDAGGGGTRFVSQVGEFEVDPLVGTINVTIDGQAATGRVQALVR